MKKYIAFIVADVVLLAYTCYITCSHTTQEFEVNEDQIEEMMKIYFDAVDVANKVGPQIIEETGGDIPITTTTAAILLANFCIQADISMHDTVDILMSAYKQAMEFKKDAS